MKGHERPLTYLHYNADGDLLFSCAKDHNPTVWYTDSGERIGTYNGHNGAVWSCDTSRDSQMLVTASADQSVKLWDLESGKPYYTYVMEGPARSVSLAEGEQLMAVSVDPFMGAVPTIHIKRVEKGSREQEDESLLKLTGMTTRIIRCMWGPLNTTIISAGEDGIIRSWDTETGKQLMETESDVSHQKAITSLAKYPVDGSHFMTGSLDKTAKLWDTRTFQLLKSYKTERPINAVDISPLFDHVVLGGGQDAASVTTTSSRQGKFEAVFYHKVYEEELGRVRGHFGPLNALAFAPDGKSFASGGEDGYVRLHHFDNDYYHMKV